MIRRTQDAATLKKIPELQQFFASGDMDSDAEAMPSQIATDGEQRSSESEENSEEVPLDRGTVPSCVPLVTLLKNHTPHRKSSLYALLCSKESKIKKKYFFFFFFQFSYPLNKVFLPSVVHRSRNT